MTSIAASATTSAMSARRISSAGEVGDAEERRFADQ